MQVSRRNIFTLNGAIYYKQWQTVKVVVRNHPEKGRQKCVGLFNLKNGLILNKLHLECDYYYYSIVPNLEITAWRNKMLPKHQVRYLNHKLNKYKYQKLTQQTVNETCLLPCKNNHYCERRCTHYLIYIGRSHMVIIIYLTMKHQ